MTDDHEEFARYLARKGKKPHVVDGLVARVVRFKESAGPRWASEGSVRAWAGSFEDDKAALKQNMRALALYFRFLGNDGLAKLANGIREGEIGKTRRKFRVSEIMGMDPSDAEALRRHGIVTAEELCLAGSTPDARAGLSEETGIPMEKVLEYVSISDISRIWAVKSIRARLYYEAGLDVRALAGADPEELYHRLREWVEETGFDGIAPLRKELEFTVKEAGKLKLIVEY
jgi:hypothetical protein